MIAATRTPCSRLARRWIVPSWPTIHVCGIPRGGIRRDDASCRWAAATPSRSARPSTVRSGGGAVSTVADVVHDEQFRPAGCWCSHRAGVDDRARPRRARHGGHAGGCARRDPEPSRQRRRYRDLWMDDARGRSAPGHHLTSTAGVPIAARPAPRQSGQFRRIATVSVRPADAREREVPQLRACDGGGGCGRSGVEPPGPGANSTSSVAVLLKPGRQPPSPPVRRPPRGARGYGRQRVGHPIPAYDRRRPSPAAASAWPRLISTAPVRLSVGRTTSTTPSPRASATSPSTPGSTDRSRRVSGGRATVPPTSDAASTAWTRRHAVWVSRPMFAMLCVGHRQAAFGTGDAGRSRPGGPGCSTAEEENLLIGCI